MDEKVCKTYFTNPEVLEEYQRTLNATTSTPKERFCRRFCKWLVNKNDIQIPLTSQGNIILKGILIATEKPHPKNHEIAALYKMIMETPFEQNDMFLSIDYCMEKCPFYETYRTWLKLTGEQSSSFSVPRLPSKTCLKYIDGSIVEWTVRSPMFTVDHNGSIVVKPHKIAYKAGNDPKKSQEEVETLIKWAYSISPIRTKKDQSKFVIREISKNLNLQEAVIHAHAENWGIVISILENHQFSAAEQKIWDEIAFLNIDYESRKVKNIKCAIQQFRSGYRNTKYEAWNDFFDYAICDPHSRKLVKMMKMATNHRGSSSGKAQNVARSIFNRYENLNFVNMDEDTVFESILDFFSITQTFSDDQIDSKKQLLYEELQKLLGYKEPSSQGLIWLKNLLTLK